MDREEYWERMIQESATKVKGRMQRVDQWRRVKREQKTKLTAQLSTEMEYPA